MKIDNILLDLHGNAHISDFNCADVFEPGRLMYDKIGTAFYMGEYAVLQNAARLSETASAPEMVRKENKGYDWRVDLWQLGGIVFEMLFDRPAFGRKRDIEHFVTEVTTRDVEFPDPKELAKLLAPPSEEATDLIRKVRASIFCHSYS